MNVQRATWDARDGAFEPGEQASLTLRWWRLVITDPEGSETSTAPQLLPEGAEAPRLMTMAPGWRIVVQTQVMTYVRGGWTVLAAPSAGPPGRTGPLT